MNKTSSKSRLTSLQKLADKAMQVAARKVRVENKRLGEPLIVTKNGKLQEIPASKL